MKTKLFLLDAMGLIFRAYYAMIKSPRFTSKGVNTSAILGFTNTLYEVLKNEKPTHIAVAFDTGAPTFRHADFQDYKANREATPDDIIHSVPYIKTILEAFRIPMVAMDGYEADDIVGTLAKHAEIEGFETYMMTSDKDYGQLVSPHIKIFKPGKFGQPAEILGPEEICAKYGINRPEQLIDMLGLWGDTSDNIPGVPGIGQVRAQKLIATYDSIENMYACHLQSDNEKTRKLMLQYKDQALMSKQLATIMLNVPVEYDFNEMLYDGPDVVKLKAIFNELEFKALAQRIFTDLSVNAKSSSAGDLFAPPTEVQMPEENNPESDFHPMPITMMQVQQVSDIEDSVWACSQQVFFEWMMLDKRIIGFAFSFGKDTTYFHYVENEHRYYQEFIRKIFINDYEVITYDVKPTYKYLKAFKISPTDTFFDIQIAHYLIQPETVHTLAKICANYFNYTLQETTEPKESVAIEHVGCFIALYPKLLEEMRQNQVEKLFTDVEMPLVEVLADMEQTGIRVDVDILRQNSVKMNEELKELEEQIFDFAGVQFNIASPKQLGEVLFEKLHIIENAKLTKSKQYQTGEEVLLKLASRHPIVPLILEWRKLTKLKSTYIDAFPQLINPKTGKIHTTFTQTITSTGRLSSVNPNLQNIPVRTERGRDIRKAFVASDSQHIILAADYSQIELRIVAHVCGDERMIETFRNHEDIHAAMAAHIFGVSQEQVTKEMRRSAKTVNFGILYGISAFGLSDRLQIPQKEARQLIEDYFRSFPKISDYLTETMEFARKNLYVETLLGRRRYIRDINSQNAILRKAAERNAINAPIQGTAADMIKIAMIAIWRDIREQHLQSKMVLQVHDELVFDTLKTEEIILRKIVSERMSGAMHLSVPLDVDINSGKSWFEAH